jgi:hypothetical protein
VTTYLTWEDAAQRITAAGVPTRPRTVQRWAEIHPGLAVKIAGRCRIYPEAVELILNGVPLADVALRMRALKAAAVAAKNPQHESPVADSRADRRPTRRRSNIGGARHRRR